MASSSGFSLIDFFLLIFCFGINFFLIPLSFFFYSTSFFFTYSETIYIFYFDSIFSYFFTLGLATIFLLIEGFFWITFFESYFFITLLRGFLSSVEHFLFIILDGTFEGIFYEVFGLVYSFITSNSYFGCDTLFFKNALQVLFSLFTAETYYFLFITTFGVEGLFLSFWGVTFGSFIIACCSKGDAFIFIMSDKSFSTGGGGWLCLMGGL